MKKLFYTLGGLVITGIPLTTTVACGSSQQVEATTKTGQNVVVSQPQASKEPEVTKDASVTVTLEIDPSKPSQNRVILNIDPATGDGKKVDVAMIQDALNSDKLSLSDGIIYNLSGISSILCNVNGKATSLIDDQNLDVLYTKEIRHDFDYFLITFFDAFTDGAGAGDNPWRETFHIFRKIYVDGEEYTLGSVHGITNNPNAQTFQGLGGSFFEPNDFAQFALTKIADQHEFVFTYENGRFYLKEEQYDANGNYVPFIEKHEVHSLAALSQRDGRVLSIDMAEKIVKIVQNSSDLKTYFA